MKRMKEVENVARIRKGEIHTDFYRGHLEKGEQLEDLRVD